MPTLADTTIRLLGQEPLAGRMPVADQLRLAEILDKAGFAYLEVSGGGCFDAAVKRGIESPWERIRALKARTKTPLGLALRGRFLVGSRPVDADFARRFVASAAENGIDVFRLHDPLNDVSNLREAAEAIAAANRDFEAGLVYSPGPTGEIDILIERAKALPELGAVRVLLHDPTGSLQPHKAEDLVHALADASGLPVGIYVQGAGGSALAATLKAAEAGAQLIACAIYPLALSLHRVSGEALSEALAGMGLDPGIDVARLWEASDLVDEHIGDEPVAPLAPRVAVRAAQHDVPAGLVAGLDATLRAQGAGDRLEEVLEELDHIRAEVGWPPLAAPIGGVLASQALLNVLAASRYLTIVDELRALVSGRFGVPPGPIDPALVRAVELTNDPDSEENVAPGLSEVRENAEGMAASEEELLLLGLFGEDAERASARDPRTCKRGGRRARLGRQGARGAHPRGRPHRPGDRHRRDHDRRGGHARVGALDSRARADVGCSARAAGCSFDADSAPVERLPPRRVADGRHLLPRARSRAHRRSSRSAMSSRPGRRSASSRR